MAASKVRGRVEESVWSHAAQGAGLCRAGGACQTQRGGGASPVSQLPCVHVWRRAGKHSTVELGLEDKHGATGWRQRASSQLCTASGRR
jgi:hypothetical protein